MNTIKTIKIEPYNPLSQDFDVWLPDRRRPAFDRKNPNTTISYAYDIWKDEFRTFTQRQYVKYKEYENWIEYRNNVES